jgi:hypothetical protein
MKWPPRWPEVGLEISDFFGNGKPVGSIKVRRIAKIPEPKGLRGRIYVNCKLRLTEKGMPENRY